MQMKSIFALLLLVGVSFPIFGKDFDYHARTLLLAAETVEVDAAVLAAFAYKESRFKRRAQSETTSAGGLFQFTDRTWKAMLKGHGRKHGIPLNASKYNARYNALMAAELLAYNQTYLKGILGRDPTPGELYLAHLLGEGGVKKLLLAKSNRKASAVLPRAAQNNRSVFYTDKGKARTVSQVRSYVNWKFGLSVKTFEAEYFRYFMENG